MMSLTCLVRGIIYPPFEKYKVGSAAKGDAQLLCLAGKILFFYSFFNQPKQLLTVLINRCFSCYALT